MIRELNLKLYPVAIVVSTSADETNQLRAGWGLEPIDSGHSAFVQPLEVEFLGGGTGQVFHIAFQNHEIALDKSIVAHETIHLKNQIFEYMGILNDPTNDEPEAYLFGYLFDLINDTVRFEERDEILPDLMQVEPE